MNGRDLVLGAILHVRAAGFEFCLPPRLRGFSKIIIVWEDWCVVTDKRLIPTF